MGPDFAALYSGPVDQIDQHLTPEQTEAFKYLDANSPNPKEARARVINQTYLQAQLKGMDPGAISSNWQAVKDSYAKQTFGMVEKNITDATLYGKIAEHVQATQFTQSKEWADASVFGKVELLMKNFGKHFGQNAEEAIAQGSKPFKELPTAPKDLPDVNIPIPGIPGGGFINPAVMGGLYNSVMKPFVEGLESPIGVLTAGTASELSALGKVYPLAKKALGAMTGIFSGIMVKQAVQGTPEAMRVMNDPNATTQEKVEAVGAPAGSALMAIASAVGAVLELKPEMSGKLKGKAPAEAAKILADEAAKAPLDEAEHLMKAANELSKVAEPKPEPNEMAQGWDEVKKVFAPAARGPEAEVAAGALREHGAELVQRTDRAAAALEDSSKTLMALTPKDRDQFVDYMEMGQDQPTPELQASADALRSILDTKREEIRALGTGKMEHFIKDYFPHIWKDPEKASEAFMQAQAKAPLQGSKAFLKKRTIPTTAEGRALGLEPVSSNPVEMVLLKAREMDKYLLGQKWLAEMKERGLVKYVPAMEQAPEGYRPIDDSISKVYGPPTTTIKEQVDASTLKALNQVMKNLGIKHERLSSLKRTKGVQGSPLGLSFTGQSKIQTKGSSALSVMAHEIGHQLDDKYGLGRIIDSEELASERKALAQLHGYKEDYFSTKAERTATAIEAWVGAKEMFKKKTPKTYAAVKNFLEGHALLKPLQDLQPGIGTTGLDYEKPHGGLLKLGEWMAPENVATVANNYLSPGLRKFASFRAYLSAANSLNQFQLGLSAFHLGFTSIDASISKLALSMEYAGQGKMLKAAARVAQVPVAPVSNMLQGNRVLKEWMRPGTQGEDIAKTVDAIRMGGGRAKMDMFYQTTITKRMQEMFKEGGTKGYIGALWRAPFAAMEQASKPIMEYIVPRQKLGVAMDMIRMENERMPVNATLEEKRAIYAKVWDSVDNRMGQMVYDNLFWNKVAKDMAMASVRSVGWNLGTLRELGGGVLDTAKFAKDLVTPGEKAEFTHRMSYSVALPVMTGILGATYQYLKTGKGPEELRDYFFPKTGEKDPQGRDIRLTIPTYMKDVYHYAHDPVGTVEGKVHPAISLMIQMLNNKDYFGREIRHADDPLMKQIAAEAKYFMADFLPIGVRQFQQSTAAGQPASERAANFLGVTQAPKWLSESAAEQLAGKLAGDKFKSNKTPDAKLVADRQKVQVALRTGDARAKEQARAQLDEMQASGEITQQQKRNLIKGTDHTYLENAVSHLDAREAMRVFTAATMEERQTIADAVERKVLHAHLPDEDRKTLHAEFNNLLGKRNIRTTLRP